MSSTVDITERKRAEAMLRESEERFRNMADTAPVMIWVSGPDKLRTFLNNAWLEFRDRTMEQELGEGWIEGVHPDDLNGCVATYSASFEARRRFQMEYRLRRADGEYRWFLDVGVPRFASDGVFAGYVGSCADITDVKQSQEKTLTGQNLESLGRLASGISHDFNNLLSGILASVELALAERAEGSSIEEELVRVRTTAIRGGEIVRQLMIYSGKASPAFELVDVSLLVEEMLHILRVSISRRAIFKTKLSKCLPAVNANPAQIRQIVMNLVTNASEAIGDCGGVIAISTAPVRVDADVIAGGAVHLPPGDYLKLEVSDTGSGMTPDVQTRIFDPFFTTKFNGHGLGLAAVQGIVRRHNGAINVLSSLGKGTRFVVLLPFTSQRAPEFRDVAVPPAGVGTVTETVLVVEDEDMLRLPVAKMLRRKGYSVIEAIDGNVAVDLFRANQPEIAVVLLDLTLSGRSGPEVFAELRRIRPDVKVILTTAYSQERALAALGGCPAWAFIQKPYRLNALLKILGDACLQERSMSSHAAS